MSEDKEVLSDSSEIVDEVDSEEVSNVPDNASWYSIQCYSLQEYKVRQRVEQLMEGEFSDKIFRVLLPEEETVEVKNNKRLEKTVKIYPGYLFIQMVPDEQAWFAVRQIPGVAKFIGVRKTPTPISPSDVSKILRKVGDVTKKVEVDFEVNETIKVISGPFRGYTGVISEINADRGKIKALISIFGRETPVELDLDQVEKVV